MTSILNGLHDEQAVTQAIESNMFTFWSAFGRLAGQERFEDERLLRVATTVPHPLFNAVFGAQLMITQIDSTIDEMIAFFRARKSPFFWWTGPMTRPSDLDYRLLAHGMKHAENNAGMAIDLSVLPDNPTLPKGLEIVVATDDALMRQWSDTANAATNTDAAVYDGLYELNVQRRASYPATYYLGLLNGEPVATSILHTDGEVAGLYAVSTLEQARGQGIGTALTLKPLLDARAQGYRVGVLQSSAMGYPLYKRMGFKRYCDLGLYFHHGR